MATTSKNKNSNLGLSKKELNRIENALQDKEFVKLLGDYANELNDPENKKKYEEEIAKLEEERGMSVVFINPKPGYVLKTKNLANGHKVFINICSDNNVAKPTSKVERVAGSQRLQWSIPFSQSQPREEGGETSLAGIPKIVTMANTEDIVEKVVILGSNHSSKIGSKEWLSQTHLFINEPNLH